MSFTDSESTSPLALMWAKGGARLPYGDDLSSIGVVSQLLRYTVLVGGHKELTRRASPGGCGQSCCDSVTQLRDERFVEPREGKGCRGNDDDQVGDYSGPRALPTTEGVPSV